MFSRLPKDLHQSLILNFIDSKNTQPLFNLLQVNKKMNQLGKESIDPIINNFLENRKFKDAILFKQNPALISKIFNDETINITPRETIDLLIQLGEENPSLALIVADYFRKSSISKKLIAKILDPKASKKLTFDEVALFILTRKMVAEIIIEDKKAKDNDLNYDNLIAKMLSDDELAPIMFSDIKLWELSDKYLLEFKEKLKNIKEDKELEEFKKSHPEYEIIETISWLAKVSTYNTDGDPPININPDRFAKQISKKIHKKLAKKYTNNVKGQYINLSGLDLSGIELPRVCLSGIDFSGCNLSTSNFEGANLSLSDLSNSDLEDANISSANLMGCRLINTKLESVKLNDETIIVRQNDFCDKKTLIKTLNKFPVTENWANHLYNFLQETLESKLKSLDNNDPNYLEQVKAIKSIFETAANQPLFTQYSKAKKFLGPIKQGLFHKEYKTSIQEIIAIQIAKLDEIINKLERKPVI